MGYNYRRISTREVAFRLEEILEFVNPFGGERKEHKVYCERCGTIQVPDWLAEAIAQLRDAYRRDELDITVNVKIKED